jgi:hypothetical protein
LLQHLNFCVLFTFQVQFFLTTGTVARVLQSEKRSESAKRKTLKSQFSLSPVRLWRRKGFQNQVRRLSLRAACAKLLSGVAKSSSSSAAPKKFMFIHSFAPAPSKAR